MKRAKCVMKKEVGDEIGCIPFTLNFLPSTTFQILYCIFIGLGRNCLPVQKRKRSTSIVFIKIAYSKKSPKERCQKSIHHTQKQLATNQLFELDAGNSENGRHTVITDLKVK